MKKLFCLLLVFTLAIPAFAEINITGQAPKTGVTAVDTELQNAFNIAFSELKDKIQVLEGGPTKFVQAMGDASVYASQGATTRGYGGYKVFTATVGPVFGVQLPKDITSVIKDLSSGNNNIVDSLKNEGDIRAGINPNVFNFHIGFNMGSIKSLPEKIGFMKKDRLYLGLRLGYFRLPDLDLGNDFNISYNNLTLGLTANYQLIRPVKLPVFFTWRGLNLGTGFIYNKSKMGFGITIDDIRQQLGGSYTDAEIVLKNPTASINITSNTFVIPLEAVTAIKFLIFNIPAGIGADIAFGKTSLGAKITSAGKDSIIVGVEGDPSISLSEPGKITVNGSVSHAPSIFNFKLMTGFGISAGPVVFDIPVTFYPASDGYTIGLTIGAVY